MVPFIIFVVHAIGFVYAFVTRRRDGGTSEGVLAVAFMGIVFAVGWTIATMLTNLLFAPDFFVDWYYQHTDSYFLSTLRKEFNQDAISLSLLTVGELCFYFILLRTGKKEKRRAKESGIQGISNGDAAPPKSLQSEEK